MRVLVFSYEYPPIGGGVGRALEALVDEWSKMEGVEVDVVTSGVGKVGVRNVSGVTVHYLPSMKLLGAELHKQRALDMAVYVVMAYVYTWWLMVGGVAFEATHTFGYPGGVVSWLFSWRWPYVVSLRGVEVPGYNLKFEGWYRWYGLVAGRIWRGARVVVANSKDLARLAKKAVADVEIRVIENGVDCRAFAPVGEKDKERVFTVTAGGTIMGRRKGLEYLVRGFAKLNKAYPKSRLILIGEGDERGRLEGAVEKLGVTGSVEFAGRRSRKWLAQHLPRYHVLCLPSLNEGMSNAVLEGMASGLAVVMTDVGGSEELIEGNGVVIKKKSSQAVYKALVKLYREPQLRKKMGRWSRELALEKTWRAAAEKYGEVYLKCVE